jgi:hypothetical protein
MRYPTVAFALLLAIGLTPPAVAQESIALGAFANYFRLSDTDHRHFAGLGGRLSGSVSPHVQFEGELAYDFEQVFTETFTDPSTGVVVFQRSPIRFLHGIFGPKFHTGEGPWRGFLVLKAGFLNFRLDDRPATFGTFLSSVEDLRASSTRAVFYPGGGLEGSWGPFGLRFEIGDEIYFLDGAHNNLRITFGPSIRF